jgi:hypothetical protein
LLQIMGLLTSAGVFTGGMGALKWALSVEKRLSMIELKQGGRHG